MNRPPFVPNDFAGKCKIFPKRDVMLLPFQQKWVTDNSRLKLCVKSRQVGLSWCTAYRVVRQKLAKGARLDAWVSSRDETQALLFIEDAKRFSNILNVAAQAQGQTVVDDQGHTSFSLRFANGLRVHSMSSNPDAQSGKHGDRILDEFALHGDPKKLYEIAFPGIVWGGSLEIFSSHRGSANYFNELLRESLSAGIPKDFRIIASDSRMLSTKVSFTSCNKSCRQMTSVSRWMKPIILISSGPVQQMKKVFSRSFVASPRTITPPSSHTI
jgi:hypothetical protein